MNPSPSHQFFRATLLLCAGLYCLALHAAQPSDLPEFANSPIDTFPADETPTPEPDNARFEQAQVDKTRYEQAIVALENSDSQYVYSASLTEAYLSLAGTLEVLEQYEDAAGVYDQALQTIRISNGLNNLEQIPVLERLQEINLKRMDWEAVETYAHLIYHIARRNYDINDGRRYQALDRLVRWKLQAANEELVSGFMNNARDAASLYSNELKLLEETGDYTGKSIHLATLHLGVARAKLAIAEQVLNRPLSDYRTTGQQTITTQRCRLVRMGDGKVTQICETVEVPNIDYYLDPSIMKNQEINQNLLDIRRSISKAFEELQKDGDVVQRNAQLAEMQELTKTYNAFVTDNGL